MTKSMVLAFSILWVGCAGFDAKSELERSVRSLYETYHAECDGREETKSCVAIQNAYNATVDAIDAYNQKVVVP